MVARTPEQAVEFLDRAFNDGDLERVLGFYDSLAVVVTQPNQTLTVRGAEELRSFFARVMPSGGTAKQLKTRVVEADGVALFTSHWTFNARGATAVSEPPTFTATTVLRKQPDGGWKILIDNPYGPQILESDQR
jgi:ketosteroid isomerase-like protein